MRVTVTAGPTNSITLDFPTGTNVGAIKNSAQVLAGLRISANMRAIIDGVEMPDNAPVRDGDTIALETRASSKQ